MQCMSGLNKYPTFNIKILADTDRGTAIGEPVSLDYVLKDRVFDFRSIEKPVRSPTESYM